MRGGAAIFQNENEVCVSYCHVAAARFPRAGREQVGWHSLASPAWRVLYYKFYRACVYRMAHQRYASTVPDAEWNHLHVLHGASWWWLPHQGKSLSDSTAAGNGSKAQSSSRYSRVLPPYRFGRGTSCL